MTIMLIKDIMRYTIEAIRWIFMALIAIITWPIWLPVMVVWSIVSVFNFIREAGEATEK